MSYEECTLLCDMRRFSEWYEEAYLTAESMQESDLKAFLQDIAGRELQLKAEQEGILERDRQMRTAVEEEAAELERLRAKSAKIQRESPEKGIWSSIADIFSSSGIPTASGLSPEEDARLDELYHIVNESRTKGRESIENIWTDDSGRVQHTRLYDAGRERYFLKKIADTARRAVSLKKRQEKKARKKAAAAAHFGKTRDEADNIRRQLFDQFEAHPDCPYCDGPMGDVPHADHIYPVSKGGLSTRENMVFVCDSCNLKKHDKTLREFVKQEGLDWQSVADVLELLGKSF